MGTGIELSEYEIISLKAKLIEFLKKFDTDDRNKLNVKQPSNKLCDDTIRYLN